MAQLSGAQKGANNADSLNVSLQRGSSVLSQPVAVGHLAVLRVGRHVRGDVWARTHGLEPRFQRGQLVGGPQVGEHAQQRVDQVPAASPNIITMVWKTNELSIMCVRWLSKDTT